MVTCSSNSRLLPSRRVLPAVILFVLLIGTQGALGGDPSIQGIRLGMTEEAVRELFGKAAIPLAEIDDEALSATRPLTPLEGAEEVRLYFENKTLHKIAILFELPPQEPTAGNLIGKFEKEKERLRGLYGQPASDVTEMRVSRPADRHEWLIRGRGYYRALWKVGIRVQVTLWLYGGDSGIVFMETYEGLK